ncbi:MAG: exonuclease domain-containing protein [Clostridia bacterium]|nr:exonuclease domain-containing protein [Clostridia bacterium]
MKYVVFDMEWNQTYGKERSLSFGKSLTGEIIEIGAVRLDERFRPEEYLRIYIKPVFYKKLHSMVKRLTGISNDLLFDAPYFPEAYREFLDFCTDDFATITWGDSDVPVLRENIEAHKLPKWTAKNYNLQSIYMKQTGQKNCVSLESATAALGIDSTDISFHDAACDAEVTAEICAKIDTASGIESYTFPIGELNESDVVAFEKVSGVVNLQKLRADPRIRITFCPECRAEMDAKRIIPQGSGKKIAKLTCPEHGDYLLRLRTHHVGDNVFTVSKTLYTWSDETDALYRDRLELADKKKEKFLSRVRGKGGKNKKKKTDENTNTNEAAEG